MDLKGIKYKCTNCDSDKKPDLITNGIYLDKPDIVECVDCGYKADKGSFFDIERIKSDIINILKSKDAYLHEALLTKHYLKHLSMEDIKGELLDLLIDNSVYQDGPLRNSPDIILHTEIIEFIKEFGGEPLEKLKSHLRNSYNRLSFVYDDHYDHLYNAIKIIPEILGDVEYIKFLCQLNDSIYEEILHEDYGLLVIIDELFSKGLNSENLGYKSSLIILIKRFIDYIINRKIGLVIAKEDDWMDHCIILQLKEIYEKGGKSDMIKIISSLSLQIREKIKINYGNKLTPELMSFLEEFLYPA